MPIKRYRRLTGVDWERDLTTHAWLASQVLYLRATTSGLRTVLLLKQMIAFKMFAKLNN